MTVDNLITFTRDQGSVTSSNVDDTTLLRYLNIAYHNIENAIVDRVDEDYFWDIFTDDTVANQYEYTMPVHDATTQWIKKINRVEIKWADGDTYHSLVRSDTIANYNRSKTTSDDYLQAQVSTSRGFWEFRDGSIFVYPVPENAVTDGLKIHAIKSLIDIVSGWAETTIFPRHSNLRQYHHLIGLGALPMVYRHRYEWDPNQIITAENIYRAELERMIDELNSKSNEPQDLVLPNPEVHY